MCMAAFIACVEKEKMLCAFVNKHHGHGHDEHGHGYGYGYGYGERESGARSTRTRFKHEDEDEAQDAGEAWVQISDLKSVSIFPGRKVHSLPKILVSAVNSLPRPGGRGKTWLDDDGSETTEAASKNGQGQEGRHKRPSNRPSAGHPREKTPPPVTS